MSFLLLAILAFTSVVRVESRAAELAQKRAIAREHARLGLLKALGDLQAAAGPDQRATATAQLLGVQADPSNFRITGVWDTSPGGSAEPRWLVSYPEDEPDPFDISLPYSRDATVELLGEGTLGPNPDGADLVRAHLVAIPDPNQLEMGHYAYWIADEGVKASIGKWNRQDAFEDDPGLTADEAKRLAQLTPGRMRNEWIFESWDGSAAEDLWQAMRDTLARTRQLEQLPLVDGLQPEELRDHFHEITWNSFGVLSNPGRGGLKIDLSFDGTSDYADDFLLNNSIRDWVDHRPLSDDTLTLKGVPPEQVRENLPAFTRPLVLAEFALYVGFFRTGRGADTLRAQVAFRSDIWNPHSFPMSFTPRGEADIIMEIEGLPQHNVSWVTAENSPQEQSGTFSLDLEGVPLTSANTGNTVNLSNFEIDLFSNMAVGEVRTIVERAEGPLPNVLSGDATFTIQDDFIWTETANAEINVRLRTPDGEILQEFVAVPVPGFSTEQLRHNIVSRSRPAYSDYQFVYHFKYYDEVLNIAPGQKSDLELWSTQVDPRGLLMDFNRDPLLEDLIFVNDPGLASIDNTLFLERPEFFYGGNGSRRRNYHRFFDIPSAPPISVGALQHLQFTGRPPYSIGNSWGQDLNAIFDNYFLSSVPQTGQSWTPDTPLNPDRPSLGNQPLPNLHLLPVVGPGLPLTLESLRSPLSSANFLVRGAFNIHSMSEKAWMAVLGGVHLYEWEYRVNEPDPSWSPPVTKPHVKNAIFRHPFGADRHFTHPYHTRLPDYPEVSQSDKRNWYKDYWQPDWATAYTVGMRELRDGANPDGINDLEDLAAAIVEALEDRALPFASFEAFANSGILQEAIDSTRINTVDGRTFNQARNDIFNRFPENAPSFLSQADILQLIAPFAQVRSDTFTIRAYGDHVNPVTGEVESRAWCEATVQRLPQPVEFNNLGAGESVRDDYLDPPGEFGRRFVITDFRWLDEDDV